MSRSQSCVVPPVPDVRSIVTPAPGVQVIVGLRRRPKSHKSRVFMGAAGFYRRRSFAIGVRCIQDKPDPA